MIRQTTGSLGRAARTAVVIHASTFDGQQSLLGPAARIRACGASLCAGHDDREVARFHGGFWKRSGSATAVGVLWIEHEMVVHFVDPSGDCRLCAGPFEMVGLVGNVIYVNREHSRPLAKLLDDGSGWQFLEDGTVWPELVFLPAPDHPATARRLLRQRAV